MDEKIKVLIVDDEEVVCLGYQRLLSGDGFSVMTAPDGDTALKIMEMNSFDVVLLDLKMPGMDGLAVLKTIKDRWPTSEVVMITGYPSLETVKEAVQFGAYDYLAKPVVPEVVIRVTTGATMQKRWALHREGPGERRETPVGPRFSWGC